jgi:hypothetical protein
VRNVVPRKQVRAWLLKHTGTSVTEHRIGRWIAAGELRTITPPRGGLYVTVQSLNDLIRRYAA